MKDNENALTIRFTGWERIKIIWLLLWTGEVRLWINKAQRIKFTMFAEELQRNDPKNIEH